VAATANRDWQFDLARELDGRHNIVNVERTRDERRTPIEHAIERHPSRLVAAVLGCNQRPAMPAAKLTQRR
jgi:hypothetical protein